MPLVETVKGELRFDGVEAVIGVGRPAGECPIEVDLNDDTAEIKEECVY
jgi:hypothetical protein